MPIPAPAVKGAIRFFSERWGGRPFVDCMPCSMMVVLRWMGWYVQDGDQKTIRNNMPGKPTGGTSFAQNMAAAQKLFAVPPHMGRLDGQFILDNLKVVGARGKNKSVFHISLDNRKLPLDSQLRRVTGIHYDGHHAIAIVAKTADNQQVYCLNPMGRDAAHPPKNAGPNWEPYTGQLEPVENLWKAVDRTPSGKIKAIFGKKNEVHSPSVPMP